MLNLRRLTITAALLLTGVASSAQEDAMNSLRNENVRLRLQVRDLQDKVNALQRNDFGSLDAAPQEGARESFYSLLDSWDGLSGEDDVLSDKDNGNGLVPMEAIDTVLCIPFDSSVRKYIDIYTIVKKENMKTILKRYDKYAPMFGEVFSKYGVPAEFSLLSVVESAVNANAVSGAGAAGMWQMMPDTALDYGLDLSPANDERFVPKKSTVAAARFLADRYREFGDWALAVMSYNCGSGTLRQIVGKCKGELTYDYLYGALPRETRDYLPALVATMYVNRNRTLIYEH